MEGSRRRGGTRRERRRGWEDVNAEVGGGDGERGKRRRIPGKGEEVVEEGDGDGGLSGEGKGKGKGEGWEDVREMGKRIGDGEVGETSDEEGVADEVDMEIRMADVSAEVRNADGKGAIGLTPGVAGEDEEQL